MAFLLRLLSAPLTKQSISWSIALAEVETSDGTRRLRVNSFWREGDLARFASSVANSSAFGSLMLWAAVSIRKLCYASKLY